MELAPVKEHAERAWEQLSERAVNIAGHAAQVSEHAAQVSEHAAHSKQARHLHRKAQRLEHTMERRFEKLAKRLPVDTPVDRTRRSQSRRRAFETGAVVVIVAGAAIAAFVVIRARRNAPPVFVEQVRDRDRLDVEIREPHKSSVDPTHIGPRKDAPTRELVDSGTSDAATEPDGTSERATPKT